MRTSTKPRGIRRAVAAAKSMVPLCQLLVAGYALLKISVPDNVLTSSNTANNPNTLPETEKLAFAHEVVS